jgi:hypothetical protein
MHFLLWLWPRLPEPLLPSLTFWLLLQNLLSISASSLSFFLRQFLSLLFLSL